MADAQNAMQDGYTVVYKDSKVDFRATTRSGE